MARDIAVEKSIVKTVAFFDGLSYALTDTEVWHRGFFQNDARTYADFYSSLHHCLEQGELVRTGAYITFPGRTELATQRIQQGMNTERKYRVVHKAVRILRLVPFIRMVGICNTLSFDAARAEGDIDLFIVAKSRRLYVAYVLSLLALELFRLRRRGLRIQNKMCLSFYVSEDGLDMSRFALAAGDPYLAQWTISVMPVFSVSGMFAQYMAANQTWLSQYFAEPRFMEPVSRFAVSDARGVRIIRFLGEALLFLVAPALEPLLQFIEKKRFDFSSHRRMRNEPSGVVVDACTLKFHEEDRRAFYRNHMNAHVNH